MEGNLNCFLQMEDVLFFQTENDLKKMMQPKRFKIENNGCCAPLKVTSFLYFLVDIKVKTLLPADIQVKFSAY